MKKLDFWEIVLQLVFFLVGLLIIFRILSPIVNPAGLAAMPTSTEALVQTATVSEGATKVVLLSNSDRMFYSKVLGQSSATINQLLSDMEGSSSGNGNSNSIGSMILTYLTGIDFGNPMTYLSSQIGLLSFMDVDMLDRGEQPPVAALASSEGTSGTKNAEDNTKEEDSEKLSNDNTKQQGNTTTDKTDAEVQLKTIKAKSIDVKKGRIDTKKPLVLIYHTHTTESFKPDNKGNNFSTTNPAVTVDEVGKKLEYELEVKYGIATLHDSTIHDYPKRNGAYTKSRPTIQKYLKKYPSLKLVIDLHRDGAVPRSSCTAIIEDKNYARTLLVAGSNFSKHEAFNKTTQKIKSLFDRYYPELCRGVDYKSASYNQDLSSKMILLEIGSNESKIQETFNTTKLVAGIIAKYIDK